MDENVVANNQNSQYLKISLSQIIPDVSIPCGLFFFYKGKYLEVIKKNQTVSIHFLAKSLVEENYFAYIVDEEKKNWEDWLFKNKKLFVFESFTELDDNHEVAVKRAKVLQCASLSINAKNDNSQQKDLFVRSLSFLRESIHSPILHSFFTCNLDESLLKHNTRVTYAMIVFILDHPDLMDIKDAGPIVFSSMIHEMTGNPETSCNDNNTHENTLSFFTKNKMIFPEFVIQLIYSHNELFNGKGVPGKMKGESMNIALRIFSIINRFDHIYLTATQNPSRKIRLENTIEKMNSMAEIFDPTVFEYFKNFIMNIDYIL